jgi:hypothetical protein
LGCLTVESLAKELTLMPASLEPPAAAVPPARFVPTLAPPPPLPSTQLPPCLAPLPPKTPRRGLPPEADWMDRSADFLASPALPPLRLPSLPPPLPRSERVPFADPELAAQAPASLPPLLHGPQLPLSLPPQLPGPQPVQPPASMPEGDWMDCADLLADLAPPPLPLPSLSMTESVPFADPELAAQAAALHERREALATVIQSELAVMAAGALPRHRQAGLIQRQLDHMQCLELLRALHLRQMRQHLAQAAPISPTESLSL